MDIYYNQLKNTVNQYYNISDTNFDKIKEFIEIKDIKKNEILQDAYTPAKYIYFICTGILRTYYIKDDGSIYNKNLSTANSFSASLVSLLTNEDSYFFIEALENGKVIAINYEGYRNLVHINNEFKDFHIKYLEENWVVEKEKYELSLIFEDAAIRYEKFISQNKDIINKIPLHHIANHLGITSTQLSRIRNKLKINICK